MNTGILNINAIIIEVNISLVEAIWSQITNNIKKEIELFDTAFEKSILNKKRIELKGRDAEQIWNEEVYPFIFTNKWFI